MNYRSLLIGCLLLLGAFICFSLLHSLFSGIPAVLSGAYLWEGVHKPRRRAR